MPAGAAASVEVLHLSAEAGSLNAAGVACMLTATACVRHWAWHPEGFLRKRDVPGTIRVAAPFLPI